MEDEEDGEVSSDLPIDVVSCNNNNCNWTISHSQLDRAMSEPLPPVDQINVGIRGTLFQHSRLTTGDFFCLLTNGDNPLEQCSKTGSGYPDPDSRSELEIST
jgi:hypothetical protein